MFTRKDIYAQVWTHTIQAVNLLGQLTDTNDDDTLVTNILTDIQNHATAEVIKLTQQNGV